MKVTIKAGEDGYEMNPEAAPGTVTVVISGVTLDDTGLVHLLAHYGAKLAYTVLALDRIMSDAQHTGQ